MMQDFFNMWQNAFNFSGKTNRQQFWTAFLFNALFELTIIYAYVSWLPIISMSVRRLHDIGKSGWWLLLHLVPLVGTIILIVYFCQPSIYDSKTSNTDDSTNNETIKNNYNPQNNNKKIEKYCEYCGKKFDVTKLSCPFCSAINKESENPLNEIRNKLNKLKNMFDNNKISKKEYDEERQKILDNDL